ncbi:hypothetical protein MNEG_2500 [Monoraphidium neglectum]|uniref:Thioredoxin domain-containing protein n=1 Tax=Monoraphidium neglectum TaxID=145388 RepID=A0A0D2NL15_9CHLO|nr:hypothetical protein MNEG_2500 [Monoraphidium neglectum]KIZ05456.1 hypothetical protein MNEG_2500 [Monoraphidium neglectum]|eukprot:XP_013904475.1 hypothetical protein MNEG_2500 [Monoraphidium neglectum]
MGAVPRFATSYYIVNTLLVGSYVLVRLWFAKSDPDTRRGQIKTDEQLLSWEKQAALALAAVLAFRLWRRRSADHAASDAFFYSKASKGAVLGMMAFMIDFRLLAWYCLAFWGAYALLPQPMIDLAESGDVASLTPTTLKEASLSNDYATMVFFYSAVHSTSVAAAPSFLQVASEFSSGKLRFGAFDVSIWPRAAAEVRMTCNTWSNQLPAVVLYEKGKEWGRLPPVGSDPSKRNYYRTGDIIRLFKLAERFNRPLDVSGSKRH